MILSGNLRHQLCPQVSGNTLGGVSLSHSLKVREDENAERDGKKLDDRTSEDETLLGVRIDGIRDYPGHQQVQAVAQNGHDDESQDERPVRLQQGKEARSLRPARPLSFAGFRHKLAIIAQAGGWFGP